MGAPSLPAGASGGARGSAVGIAAGLEAGRPPPAADRQQAIGYVNGCSHNLWGRPDAASPGLVWPLYIFQVVTYGVATAVSRSDLGNPPGGRRAQRGDLSIFVIRGVDNRCGVGQGGRVQHILRSPLTRPGCCPGCLRDARLRPTTRRTEWVL